MAICVGLRARREDIEQVALARVYAVSDPSEAADPEYAEGLRAAVSAALDYGLAALERGERRSPPIPAVLLTQARLAARNGVNLDTVLRRYFAGYTLLGDFLLQTAEEEAAHGASLQQIMREQAILFDRLVAAVTAEFEREKESLRDSIAKRRAERVQRLLDGELLDTAEFGYDFEGHHLGAIVAGPEVADAVRALAAAADRRFLSVHPSEGVAWAWLGGRRAIDASEVERLASASARWGVSLAIGEPGQGFTGWRITHNQAKAAWPIAMRGAAGFTRYRDVALLASVLSDDLLSASLREIYIAPLVRDRDGGQALRQTLRAYFAAERNVSSAAAKLCVTRQTVMNRLRTVEERLERQLSSCAAELEVALRLEDLGYLPSPSWD